MKHIMIGTIAALLATAGIAQAQVLPTTSTSGSNANVTINNPGDIRSTIRNVPGAIAPGLTASAVETCLGSASVGGSGMGWGAAFGLTIKDKGCEARLDAKMLATLGQGTAAVLRLCTQTEMARALQATGVDCAGYLGQGTRTVAYAPARPQRVDNRVARNAQVVNDRSGRRVIGTNQVASSTNGGKIRVFNHMDQRWDYK